MVEKSWESNSIELSWLLNLLSSFKEIGAKLSKLSHGHRKVYRRMYGRTDVRTYGCTDVRTYGCTDGRKISPFYRTSSPIGAAAQKELPKTSETNGKELSMAKMAWEEQTVTTF